MPCKPSSLESRFIALLADHSDIPAAEREHLFALEPMGRRWRFDFAWPDARIAVEVEGSGGATSRHRTMAGYHGDAEKYNSAACLGWIVLRFDTLYFRAGREIEMLEQLRAAFRLRVEEGGAGLG